MRLREEHKDVERRMRKIPRKPAVRMSAWLECARYHEARAHQLVSLIGETLRDRGMPQRSKDRLCAHLDKWKKRHLKWSVMILEAHSNDRTQPPR